MTQFCDVDCKAVTMHGIAAVSDDRNVIVSARGVVTVRQINSPPRVFTARFVGYSDGYAYPSSVFDLYT